MAPIRLRRGPTNFEESAHNPTKLGVRTDRSFTIEHVHINDNITIQLRPGVTKRINTWRVISYR
jgi:hypothetical protein